MNKITKEKLVRLAMNEAEKGIKKSNSPFGAVLADKKENVIAKAYNTTKSAPDPTGHAEINVLRKAGKKLRTRKLDDYCLFSNGAPCSMCMSAAIHAGITLFYFGAPHEEHMNPWLTVFDVAKKATNKIHIESGILEKECTEQIQQARKKYQKVYRMRF